MLPKTTLLALVCLCGLLVLASATQGATYVFGEDGLDQDLTGSGAGSTWTSADEFIIAGDCYVEDNDTLTIGAGVEVKFDYDYDGDFGSSKFPTITVSGTIICNGTENSQVWFKNYSGTNKGEFEGLQLKGAIDKEGNLEALHTVFEYGGYTTALIQLDEKSKLSLDHCFIRYSDTDGISTVNDSCYILLKDCYIDSNDAYGIECTDLLDSLHVEGGYFYENGIRLLGFGDHNRANYMRGVVIDHSDTHGVELGSNCHDFELQCSQIYDSDGDGVRIDFDNDNGSYPIIQNCGIAHNGHQNEAGNGINLVNFNNGIMNHDVIILNNVIWDNFDYGIFIDPEGNEWEDLNCIVQNNFIGCNGDFGVIVTPAPLNMDDIDDINSFKDNGDGDDSFIGVTFTNFYSDEGDGNPDNLDLADETWAGGVGNTHYKFHILWNSPEDEDNTLINSGDQDNGVGSDPDGSDTDQGMFGGELADDYGLEFYTRVNSGYEDSEGITILRNTYRAWGNWIFLDDLVEPGQETGIDAGTIIEFNSVGGFVNRGDLTARGDADNHVVFRAKTGNQSGWNGVVFNDGENNSASRDCQLRYVDISGVTNSNYPGLYISRLNDQADQTHMIVRHCTVSGGGGSGIRIYCSNVEMKESESTQNDDCGIYVAQNGVHDVIVLGCTFSQNGDDQFWSSGFCAGANSYPSIGYIDNAHPVADIYTVMEQNEQYGLYCRSSAAPVLSGGAGSICGWNKIFDNDDDQIYIIGWGTAPVLAGGHNDIYSPNFEALAIDNDTGHPIDATDNYWGTTDPEGDAADLFEGVVDYTAWDDSRNTTNGIETFWIAMHHYMKFDPESIARSIPIFKEVAEDETCGMYRCVSLKYLRDAYNWSKNDFAELREYYLDYARGFEGTDLSILASHQSIWCLSDMGRHEEAIRAFRNLRLNAESREDSLWAALDELMAMMVAGVVCPGNDNETGSDWNPYTNLIEHVSFMLSEEQRKNAGELSNQIMPVSISLAGVYPNPFNSNAVISFELPEISRTSLSIYDLMGREVFQILNKNRMSPGKYTYTIDGTCLPAGLYIAGLRSGDRSRFVKFSVIK